MASHSVSLSLMLSYTCKVILTLKKYLLFRRGAEQSTLIVDFIHVQDVLLMLPRMAVFCGNSFEPSTEVERIFMAVRCC